jgi:hypothetical protein
MTKVVAPNTLQYGDLVEVSGQAWVVKGIEGPDTTGAWDLYLTDGSAARHEVVTEAVTLVY